MNKLAPLVVSLCLIAWLGVAAEKAPMEGLKFKLDPDWYMLESGGDSTSGDAVYFRHSDDPNHWKEIFRFRTGRIKSNQKSPEEEFNIIKADIEKHCPGGTTWNVIGHDENSISFEWQSKPCKGSEGHELDAIWRIIQGKQSWFEVMYTARVYEVAPETRTKWIATLKDATINPDVDPVDLIGITINIDEVVPFPVDKVMAALKPAMESQDCYLTSTTADSIECKRPRAYATSQHDASGGESVTAKLEAQGDQAHVIITTGKGFYGRLAKKNWSTPIYQELMKNLQKAQP